MEALPTEDWYCLGECGTETPHTKEYVPEQSKPFRSAVMKFTCTQCKGVMIFDAAEYFDAHVCRSDGDWCFCDDTMHKHCDQCDSKCSYNRDYEC